METTTTTDQWARLRAALDGWNPPVGIALHYAIDERAGRLNINLTAECGGTVFRDWKGIATAERLARMAARMGTQLDAMAFQVLRDHVCCCGRLPRAIRRAGRHFEAWADDYAFLSRYQAKGGRHQC